MANRPEGVLLDIIERKQEECAFADIIYNGHMLAKERHPEDPTTYFTDMIDCLKEITNKGDTDIMFLREEARKYEVTPGEISRLCDSVAGELGNTITNFCKTNYVVAPLTKFMGCPLSDAEVEDAGGVVAYGNLTEGRTVQYDGYTYEAVGEKVEHNDYYTIKCFILMPR